MDLVDIRTALIISLSITVVVLAWKRFRDHVRAKDLPAPLHAELITVEVAYHPSRLRIQIKLPGRQLVHTALLDGDHRTLHDWPANELLAGEHEVEHLLPELQDGGYFLEMRTDTQRTVRHFRLRQA